MLAIKSIFLNTVRSLLIAVFSINAKNFLGLALILLHQLRIKRYGSKMLKFKTSVEFDYSVDSIAFNADGDMIAGSGFAATGLTVSTTSDGEQRAFFKYTQASQLSNAIAWSSTGVIGYPHAAGTELRLGEIHQDGTSTEQTVMIAPFVQCEYVSFSPNGEYAAMPGRINHKDKQHNLLNKLPIPDVLIVRVQTGETFPISTGYLAERLVWLSEEEIAVVGDPYRGSGRYFSCFNIKTSESRSVQISAGFTSAQLAKDFDTRTIFVSGWHEDSKGLRGDGASTIWCLSEGVEGNWVVQKQLSIPWNSDGDAKCYALQYSQALKRLVALVYDETQKPIRVIDPETGAFEGVYIGGFKPNRSLAVSSDGRQVAIAVGTSARIFEFQN
jgi:WD40 repeat protein